MLHKDDDILPLELQFNLVHLCRETYSDIRSRCIRLCNESGKKIKPSMIRMRVRSVELHIIVNPVCHVLTALDSLLYVSVVVVIALALLPVVVFSAIGLLPVVAVFVGGALALVVAVAHILRFAPDIVGVVRFAVVTFLVRIGLSRADKSLVPVGFDIHTGVALLVLVALVLVLAALVLASVVLLVLGMLDHRPAPG